MHDPEGLGERMSEGKMRGEQKAARREHAGGRGGIQEEAPGIGKPVLVMRDVTERPEGISSGTVKLVGTSSDAIIGEVSKLLDDKKEYSKMSKAVNPYGDGNAADRILSAIKTMKT